VKGQAGINRLENSLAKKDLEATCPCGKEGQQPPGLHQAEHWQQFSGPSAQHW